MALDLNSIKEQIQSVFQAANTTTASRDLSSGLTNRVQRVLKVNPYIIPVQADWYPFVTSYIDSKLVTLLDVCQNQMMAKRTGEISVKVVGAVWNNNLSDPEVDAADEDCEDLMENIEEILRANPTLGGSVIGTAVVGSSLIGPTIAWSYPSRVSYHNFPLAEGVHVRVGMLDLIIVTQY